MIASDAEFGDEVWVSYQGKPLGVGIYKSGEVHPQPRLQPLNMITREFLKGDAASVAVYSDCEQYRYLLTRVWDPAGKRALFIMLNPSTATEQQNDPTVERCERRARALGFGAFRVCNIFAYRATDPKVMRAVADPVGPENDAAILESLPWADQVICAWGGAWCTSGARRGDGADLASKRRHPFPPRVDAIRRSKAPALHRLHAKT